jgi:hypothetical protein
MAKDIFRKSVAVFTAPFSYMLIPHAYAWDYMLLPLTRLVNAGISIPREVI